MHAEDNPDYFICDKRVSKAIAILNQKGYETLASWGGHYNGGCSEGRNVDISFLKEAKENKHIYIREVREKDFDYYAQNETSHIYVLFKKVYFDKAPEGFTLETDEYAGLKRNIISCDVNYFKENDDKMTWSEVEIALDKYAKILENWAEKLPYNKKGND